MPTFTVTFRYLGRVWFLCGRFWTEEAARASHHTNEEAAGAALTKARRYMRNKQLSARIVMNLLAAEASVRRSREETNADQPAQFSSGASRRGSSSELVAAASDVVSRQSVNRGAIRAISAGV